jgi:glycosyltransferase involved in cell wall biosynthesis
MPDFLYVTSDDAQKPNSENNGYYLGKALIEAGATVEHAQLRDFTSPEKGIAAIKKLLNRLQGQQYRAKADPMFIDRKVRDLLRHRNDHRMNLVFSNSGMNLGGLGPDVPYAFYTDAPVCALRSMGHFMDEWSPRMATKLIEFDRRAVQNAHKVIYHSEWAVNQAVEGYGLDRSRLAVVAPGANLPWIDVSLAATEKPKSELCKLLFFGRDWVRKGGTKAHCIAQELDRLGVRVQLHVCGPEAPPASIRNERQVIWHPPINKLFPDEIGRLSAIMQDTDYMLLPTLADTSTSAIREACAFGVPSVVTAIGGLGEMVTHGKSGFLIRDTDDPFLLQPRSVTTSKATCSGFPFAPRRERTTKRA